MMAISNDTLAILSKATVGDTNSLLSGSELEDIQNAILRENIKANRLESLKPLAFWGGVIAGLSIVMRI